MCIVGKSLSVVMTFRVCLCEMCFLLLFGCKPLGKSVFSIYVFHYGHLWRWLDVAFFALNSYFHLQITGVCNQITSRVTRKSAELAF